MCIIEKEQQGWAGGDFDIGNNTFYDTEITETITRYKSKKQANTHMAN